MEKRKQLNWEEWGRAGKYFIENKNGREYIRPVPESGYIKYDFNSLQKNKSGKRAKEDYLISQILNLDTTDKTNILKFVDRFGLLGLLQHKYLEPQTAIIDGKEYYFVPERNGDTLHLIDEIASDYLIDADTFQESGFYFVRSKMSEPLNEFVAAINEFQDIIKFAYAIKKAEQGVSGPLRKLFLKDPYLKEYAKREIERIIPMAKTYLHFSLIEGNLGLSSSVIKLEDTWESRWGFTSLLSAAYFFFIQDMGGNYRLDICPRCGRLFLSSVSTRLFCSRKCEDANRKARSRKLKKEVK